MKKQLKITDSLNISSNKLFLLVLSSLASLFLSACGGESEDSTPPTIQESFLQKTYSPFDTITIQMSEGLNVLDPAQQCNYNMSQYSINWSSVQSNIITIFSKKFYGYDATNIPQFKDTSLSISCSNLSDKAGNTNKIAHLKFSILPIADSDIKDSVFKDKNGIGSGADTLALTGKFVKNSQDMKDSMVFAGYLTGNKFQDQIIDLNDFYMIQAKANDTIQVKLYGVKNSNLSLEFKGPQKNLTYYQDPSGKEKVETPNAQGVLEINATIDATRQFIVANDVTTYQNYWIHIHFRDLNNPIATPYRLMVRRK
jgi:hypothetical protein